jgi:hypothetical protein
MTSLHVGTRDAEALIELLPTDEVIVFRDGDSWEEWGEGMGEHPEHLVIQTRSPLTDSIDLLRDIAYILSQGPTLLEPMQYPRQAGTLAIISDSSEWDVQYYALMDEEARKQILGACTHERTHRIDRRDRPHGPRVHCEDCHTEFSPEKTFIEVEVSDDPALVAYIKGRRRAGRSDTDIVREALLALTEREDQP